MNRCASRDIFKLMMTAFQAFSKMFNFFPKNVKEFYFVAAALVEHIPFEVSRSHLNVFTKRLKYSLQSHELSSVSKDLFIALAKRAENSKQGIPKFFTFCKKMFGNYCR